MKGETNNKRQAKLLAAVAVMAMVVCALAVAMPAEEADGADVSLETVNSRLANEDYNLTATLTINNGETLTIPEERTLTVSDGGKIIVQSGGIAVINGILDSNIENAYNNTMDLMGELKSTNLDGGQFIGHGNYIEINVKGDASISGITFTKFGMWPIDITGGSTIAISKCNFDSTGTNAGSAIYVEGSSRTGTISINDCTFNGDYNEGAINFDMIPECYRPTVNIDSSTPSVLSIGSARGNITIGGDNANIRYDSTNVSISDVYLNVAGNYTEASASKLTVDGINLDIQNVYGNGSVEAINSARFVADMSEVPVTADENSSVAVEETVATTLAEATELLRTMNDVTLVSETDITMADNFTIGANKTLRIVDMTKIYGDVYKFIVNGTLYLDNAYVYAGAQVNETTGEIVAVNTHNPITTQSLTQDTRVGIGDSLTFTGSIPNGVTLSVFGTLIANDITVEGAVNAYVGSTVTINGTATVAERFTLMSGAELELNGTITIRDDRNGDAQLVVSEGAKMTVTSEGTVNVNRPTANGAAPNVLEIEGTFVLEGTMNVTGTLLGQIENKGTVTFNGTAGSTAENATTIVMYDGVTMTVGSVSGYMTVTDGTTTEVTVGGTPTPFYDVIMDYLGKDSLLANEKASAGNSVTLYNVKGVTISEAVTSANDKIGGTSYRSYMANMTVSGTVTVVSGQTAGSVTVNGDCDNALAGVTGLNKESRCGTMTVADVTVGSGVTFGFQGTSTISGAFTAIAGSTSGTNAMQAATVNNDRAADVTVTGTVTVTQSNADNFENGTVNAVRYYTIDQTDGDITYYYTNFADALGAVSGAYGNEIAVIGTVTAEGTTELAAGMYLIVEDTLTIGTDAQFTVAATAVATNNGKITVNGVMVVTDNNTGLIGNAPVYDVKKTVESTDTYSSLTYALANSNPGDVIVLSNEVTLRTNTVIPEGVTLQTGRNKVTLAQDVTLTVNGTFAVQNGGSIDKTATGSKIVVNGVMSSANSSLDLERLDIAGAYFTVRNVDYVSNVAYAAANIGNGTEITIRGTVSAGDVTFTAGTSGLTVTVAQGAVLSAGTITIDGADIVLNGTMTGTISAAANGSTAGIDLNKVSCVAGTGQTSGSTYGLKIQSEAVPTVDGETDYLYISGYVNSGTVTIAAGTVTVMNDGTGITADRLVINTTGSATRDGSVVVKEGATLSVPKNTVMYAQTNSGEAENIFSVAGTLDVAGTANISGIADIAGTANIAEGAAISVGANSGSTGMLTVTGSIIAVDTDNGNGTFAIAGGASAAIEGTVSGPVTIDASSYMIAYPGASLDAAKIEWNALDESEAVSTQFYINGAVYMTVYGGNDSTVGVGDVIGDVTFDMPGYDVGYKNGSDAQKGLYLIGNWFSTKDLTPGTELTINRDDIASNEAVYAEVEVSDIIGTISEGTGLTMYIDGLTISNWMATIDGKYAYYLPVGTHTVSIAANAGYNADNATITFNGQTVANGGTITIEAGATGFTLAASGAVPAASVSGGSTSDDGLGLTDILLIILVVLIVVMAIMVALRLMRS